MFPALMKALGSKLSLHIVISEGSFFLELKCFFKVKFTGNLEFKNNLKSI